ncbi:hypothetical protein HP532_03580 [Pseudomonas sp. CrR25]|nr:hypothetical protein [Pseudomonas sp. CrR25]
MKHLPQPRDQQIIRVNPQQGVGGAIIDANGREIPITEQMIRQACRELENSSQAVHRRA